MYIYWYVYTRIYAYMGKNTSRMVNGKREWVWKVEQPKVEDEDGRIKED